MGSLPAARRSRILRIVLAAGGLDERHPLQRAPDGPSNPLFLLGQVLDDVTSGAGAGQGLTTTPT
jgi:hypothetical protein